MEMLEPFRYRMKQVDFWTVTGTVTDVKKYATTSVSGGGVSGSVYGGGVSGVSSNISGAPVTSTTTIHLEFWLNTTDGQQQDFHLRADIPLAAGQQVTLILGCLAQAKRGTAVALVNHSAGRWWQVDTSKELNERFKLERVTGKTALIAIMLFFLVLDFRGGLLLASTAAIGYCIVGAIIKHIRKRIVTGTLTTHLEKLAQETFSKVLPKPMPTLISQP